jgi:phosphonate transport system substrate-binding protein
MSSVPPAPAAPPSRTGTYAVTVGLILLLAAGAGGYYWYVRSQHPEPPPVDEFANLKTFFRQLGKDQALAPGYTDADKDLVADPPTDPAKFQKVEEVGFSVVGTPDEERAKAEQAEWADFMAALEKATGKKVVYRTDLPGPDAQMTALRDGRLHVTAFNTGAVPAAVNTAGFVPLFVPADAAGNFSYQMQMLVRADSPVQKPEDLRGKMVGFVALSSNSGAKAPMYVLREKFGMLPGRDYQFTITGDHYASLAALAAGSELDAACVASDLKDRAFAAPVKVHGREVALKPEQFRVIYTSEGFPPLCFGVAHDLPPDLREQVAGAFRDFRFEGTSVGKRYAPQGKVKFAPVNYDRDWEFVREIDTTLSRLADVP